MENGERGVNEDRHGAVSNQADSERLTSCLEVLGLPAGLRPDRSSVGNSTVKGKT